MIERAREWVSRTRAGSRALRRLNEDFRLAMIVSFGLFAVAVISGFAVYRFASGQVVGGWVNLGIVAGVSLVVTYAWRFGHTDRAGMVFVLVTVLGCLTSALVLGRTGLLWSYVILWINFLLAPRHFALAMNLLMMAVLLIFGLGTTAGQELFGSGLESLTYGVTALLATAYGYIFAARYQSQQEALEALANRDPLTEAWNRRRMRRDLAGAVAQSRRSGRPESVLLLDLDHFKAVNDHRGHEAGDRILRDFAELAGRRLEDGARIYRFGGEEFVLYFPGADAGFAACFGRELQAEVGGSLRGVDGPLRFSGGVAELLPGEAWSDWLARADLALYRAKRGGRNRIEVSRPDRPESA